MLCGALNPDPARRERVAGPIDVDVEPLEDIHRALLLAGAHVAAPFLDQPPGTRWLFSIEELSRRTASRQGEHEDVWETAWVVHIGQRPRQLEERVGPPHPRTTFPWHYPLM